MTEERERRRIAADLHDRIGQTLAAARIKLGTFRNALSQDHDVVSLDDIDAQLKQTILDTRSLIFDLSPPILHELGLVAALEWLSEGCRSKYGIDCTFEDDGKPKSVDDGIGGLLFRSAQELIVNAAKHAGIDSIKLMVKADKDRIIIVVEDHGVGFDPAVVLSPSTGKGGFGLFKVRERLDHLHGKFEIAAAPGQGCRITLVAPVGGE